MVKKLLEFPRIFQVFAKSILSGFHKVADEQGEVNLIFSEIFKFPTCPWRGCLSDMIPSVSQEAGQKQGEEQPCKDRSTISKFEMARDKL